MTTYNFEATLPAEALAYNSATDDLVFTTPGTTARDVFATYNFDGGVRIYSAATGRTLTFGPGLQGEFGIAFANSSVVMIGTAGAETEAGGSQGDKLYGGDGDDVLIGGGGSDVLEGGPGADLYVVRPGDSNVALGVMDEIYGWSAEDRISFLAPAPTETEFLAITAEDWVTAKRAADAQIATGAVNYVAAQVGGFIYLFVDSADDNGVADTAVQISGSAGSFTRANIVGPLAFGSVSPPRLGGVGADTLSGDNTSELVRGFSGGDSLSGGAGDDTVVGDDGDDWLVGGGGVDQLSGGDGYDTFLRVSGDSAPARSEFDTITDWSVDDRLVFSQVFGGAYLEATEADYLSAYGRANTAFAGGSARYVAIQVGGDVFVFADSLSNGGVGDVVRLAGRTLADISGFNIQGATGSSGGWPGPESVTLTGAGETYTAGAGNDSVNGQGGDDVLAGQDGDDSIAGGAGNDTVTGAAGRDYLRGDDGHDSLQGGAEFDDINGNAGNDTASGGDGDDWVVGGKDNDSLSGDAGADIVYGNLGNDTCDGGAGADLIRGGQGDDILFGRDGDDWISGDRGDDTMTGGLGADTFHSSQDAGVDRVLDFHYGEGDRVRLDAGTTYELRQIGDDLWVYMGGNHQVILVGVNGVSLPADWIFVG